MNALAINGFLLGLSTGVFCLGSCLPVLLPFILVEKRKDFFRNLLVVLEFSGGRMVAYLIVGFIVGYLGKKLTPGGSHLFMAAVMVGLSVLLLGYGLVRTFPHVKMCFFVNRITGDFKRFPFLMGILLGLNVCPPFLLAITYTLDNGGGPLTGVLFFLFFFLGTSVFIIPLAFMGPFSQFPWLLRLSKVSLVASGVIFLGLGLKGLLIL